MENDLERREGTIANMGREVTIIDVTRLVASRLAGTGRWRVRQKLSTLSETMATEIVPVSTQIDERRYFDAADYLIASYWSAKELIALVDRYFPEVRKLNPKEVEK